MFNTMHLSKIILVASSRIGRHLAAWLMERAYVTSKHRAGISWTQVKCIQKMNFFFIPFISYLLQHLLVNTYFCKDNIQVDGILLSWNSGDFCYLVLSLLVHSFRITKINVKTWVQMKKFLQLWKCHRRLHQYNKTERKMRTVTYYYYTDLVLNFDLKVVSVLFRKFYTTGFAK